MRFRGKSRWVWFAGGVASLALVLNRRLFTVNDVTAGRSTAYPNLKPQRFPYPPTEIFALAEAAAWEKRWRVISVDRLGREIQLEADVFLGLVDDVTIRVEGVENDTASEVVVRSRSRVGAGDLGENARRIRGFYRSLAARVKNATNAAAPKTV